MRSVRWTRHLGVVFSLVAWIALVPGTPARATWSGPNGRIAFWDFMSGQIYSVDPDGTGLVQLTHATDGQTAAFPRWSPDSTHIAFESNMGGPQRIWMMDASGGDQHQIVGDRRGFGDFAPSYTPNGRQIIYTRCLPDGGCSLWQVRTDGTHRVALTPFQTEVFDFASAVSPDGRRIAFARFSAGGVIAQIYVMGRDGSDPTAITPPALEAFNPTWSPDGRYILFANNCCKANSDVFVMKPNGTGLHALTSTEFPANSVPGSFSPEGDQIAFDSDRNHGDLCCEDLFLMRANGTHESLLDTGILGAIDPQWGSAPALTSGPPSAAPTGSTQAGQARRCWGYEALTTGSCT